MEESVLAKPYTVSIFRLLRENGKAVTTDLKEITSYYQGVVRRARELEAMGFITTDTQEKPYRKTTYGLTADGRDVANILEEVEKVVSIKAEGEQDGN